MLIFNVITAVSAQSIQTLITNSQVDVTSIPNQEVKVLCNSSGGAVILQLPLTTTYPAQGLNITVCDVSSNAGTNNITVRANTGEQLNNVFAPSTGATISTDNAALEFFIVREGLWASK